MFTPKIRCVLDSFSGGLDRRWQAWGIGIGVTLATLILAGTSQPAAASITWQQWLRRNPTYRYLPSYSQPTSSGPETFSPRSSGIGSESSQFSASSNMMAFLRVIRFAEGTSSADGYQMMFTSRRFSSFEDHPRQRNCSWFRGRTLCSTAAGAYQFLDTTWDGIARLIGARDFSPAWQDRGAVELIRRAGALGDVEAGNIQQAIGRTAGVWASFPRWAGDRQGRYSQAVRPMAELVQVFNHFQQLPPQQLSPQPPVQQLPTEALPAEPF